MDSDDALRELRLAIDLLYEQVETYAKLVAEETAELTSVVGPREGRKRAVNYRARTVFGNGLAVDLTKTQRRFIRIFSPGKTYLGDDLAAEWPAGKSAAMRMASTLTSLGVLERLGYGCYILVAQMTVDPDRTD